MIDDTHSSRFVIASLPRSGSTTLARLLSCHPDIRCLIEPFHPRRYGGHFHAAVMDDSTLESVLRAIWRRWNGIKHVWEAGGWPFPDRPSLNDSIMTGLDRKIVLLVRRNFLRRFVSNYISRQARYWIGTRDEFHLRLEAVALRPLNSDAVRAQIYRDQSAIKQRMDSLVDKGTRAMVVYYEDLFSESASSADRLTMMNSILEFLAVTEITQETLESRWLRYFDPTVNRWASADVYGRIPEIRRVEEEVGSDETGWLFKP